MDKEEVEKQLNRVTDDYRSRIAQRNEAGKFSVTVWVAVLIAVATEKLNLTTVGNVILLMTPVLMFWFLELVQASVTTRRLRFICTLEERLATNNMESENPIEIYFASMDQKTGLREKLKDLLATLTKKEILHLLYVMQLIFSVFFVILFSEFKVDALGDCPNGGAYSSGVALDVEVAGINEENDWTVSKGRIWMCCLL